MRVTRCSFRCTGSRRGFTLIELMVVLGIIMLMMALAIPAIKKFSDGQRLSQSGRILQSAFNEARRAAITQREKQYLIFYRDVPEGVDEVRYGVRRYRDRFGYEGDGQLLLPGVQFDQDPNATGLLTGTGFVMVGRLRALGVPLFDGLPEETNATLLFGTTRQPDLNAGAGWVEFRRDGTIDMDNSPLMSPQSPPTGGPAVGLFDLNTLLDVVPDSIADDVDLSLRETGDYDVNERCFIDIDPNTGRVRFRVVKVEGGGTTTG
jgi:prepilin-type N-terminal cleavage/methylation domain-containing protein